MTHPQRMRAGVGPDYVAARRQLAELSFGEEPTGADVVTGDEKMSDAPVILEHFCRRIRTLPAIVEGDYGGGKGRMGRMGRTGRTRRDACDRVEVRRERAGRDFLERGVASGEPAAVFVAGRDDVVIHQRVHTDFRFLTSDFRVRTSAAKRLLARKKAVSHG